MNETTTTTRNTLPIVVPPMLEAAIGYCGDARFVAFYFDGGDEAYHADGHLTTVGEWDAYELFINHPLVAPHLRAFHLGSSDEPPTHYLLLDRESRNLSVAEVSEVQRFLREQWGPTPTEPEPLLVVSEEEWQRLVTRLMTPIPQFSSNFEENWREHQRLVEELASWLAQAWEGVL